MSAERDIVEAMERGKELLVSQARLSFDPNRVAVRRDDLRVLLREITRLRESLARQSDAALGDDREAKWARWPNGDAGDAVDWACDHISVANAQRFLDDWRDGRDMDTRWPGYMKWMRYQRECARAALAPQEDDAATEGR